MGPTQLIAWPATVLISIQWPTKHAALQSNQEKSKLIPKFITLLALMLLIPFATNAEVIIYFSIYKQFDNNRSKLLLVI